MNAGHLLDELDLVGVRNEKVFFLLSVPKSLSMNPLCTVA